ACARRWGHDRASPDRRAGEAGSQGKRASGRRGAPKMTTPGEAYTDRLRADLRKLQAAIDAAVEYPPASPAAIDRIYALLYNTRVQGEAAGSTLVTSISALACGILKRSRSPDEGACRVIKAHVDALAI